MNILGVIFFAIAAIALMSVPRRWAVIPLLMGVIYITHGQAVNLGGIKLPVFRMLLGVGLLRIIVKGEGFAGGFNRIDKSADPSPINGRRVYERHCMQCHGADMLGRKFANRPGYMFPPLAGPDSYNKGAGMHKVKTCASFVQANMPLGKPNTLTDDEALEACVHIHLADRPWDPRKSWVMNLFNPTSEAR